MEGIFYGGPMEQMVAQWSQMGVFTVLLPFVLVFSVVFAILEKIDLLKNRGVHVIISLAVAFFTIANPYVVSFFTPLFSNLGLGVAILICAVIVLGFALKIDDKTWTPLFTIMGIIIFIVILARAKIFSGASLPTCDANCQAIIVFVIIIVIAVVAALMWSNKDKDHKKGGIPMMMAPKGD